VLRTRHGPGSSVRARAIEEARFEVVAYRDDDDDVDPNWLASLRAAAGPQDVAIDYLQLITS
jgi:hypothetical protein